MAFHHTGFHLPNDKHVCPSCHLDWYAEYDEDEEIICPYCKKEVKDETP